MKSNLKCIFILSSIPDQDISEMQLSTCEDVEAFFNDLNMWIAAVRESDRLNGLQ